MDKRKQKQAVEKYHKTIKGKAALKAARHKYNNSYKGRESRRRYLASVKGKEAVKRYKQNKALMKA